MARPKVTKIVLTEVMSGHIETLPHGRDNNGLLTCDWSSCGQDYRISYVVDVNTWTCDAKVFGEVNEIIMFPEDKLRERQSYAIAEARRLMDLDIGMLE